MQRLNYWEFPGFENIYLEDSYVLAFNKTDSSVEIPIEAVLTENHPLYAPPLPGEQYCYRQMTIKFVLPQTYNLVLKKMAPIRDRDGSVDYGNIDEFFLEDGKYYLNGEWGELTIVSEPPILDNSNHVFGNVTEFTRSEELSFSKIEQSYTKFDDLKKEIQKKFAVGYPKDNIIFQRPDRAVLYQDGKLAIDEDFS